MTKTVMNGSAVVVGGAGGIGRYIVRRLCDAGLDVIVVGRNKPALDELAGQSKIRPCIADIACDTSIASIGEMIEHTVRMVVHTAGLPLAGGVLDAPPEMLGIAANIKAGGMLRLVRAVDPHLQRGSRLVAIGGHYGFEPSAAAALAGVGNAALTNLMRQLNLAYGKRGITSHLIVPGPVETERLNRIAFQRAEQEGIPVEVLMNRFKAESAIGAFTTPDQVAWAVGMLLAPEADALAGSSLMMDAGRRKGIP
jgi:NAD(P)-dependent dehydrogenase (short-subunit alcohol dehydrogenase family)